MLFCLKQFQGFSKFLKFNNISDDSLLNACKYFSHKEIGKGDFLYKEGDKAEMFYGVVSGHIIEEKSSSIFQYIVKNPNLLHNIRERKSKKNSVRSNASAFASQLTNQQTGGPNSTNQAKKKKKDCGVEDDSRTFVNYFKLGDCFGDHDLLHLKKKAANAYATEHTHLFVLDSTSFNYCFSKDLIKSEFERNDFLCKNVFNGMDQTALFSIFALLKPVILDYGEYFYHEGSSKTDLIFILYQGTAVIEKKIIRGIANSFRETLNEDKQCIASKILHISPGFCAGLEVLSPVKSRKYSMKATSPFTSALCFEYSQIAHDIIEKLKEKLKPYTTVLDNAHNKFSTKYYDELHRNVINYHTYTNINHTLFDRNVKVNKINKIVEQCTSQPKLVETHYITIEREIEPTIKTSPSKTKINDNDLFKTYSNLDCLQEGVALEKESNLPINENAKLISGTNIKFSFSASKLFAKRLFEKKFESSKKIINKKKLSSKLSKLMRAPYFDSSIFDKIKPKLMIEKTVSTPILSTSTYQNYSKSILRKDAHPKILKGKSALEYLVSISNQNSEVRLNVSSTTAKFSKIKSHQINKRTSELVIIREDCVQKSEGLAGSLYSSSKKKQINGSIDSEECNTINSMKHLRSTMNTISKKTIAMNTERDTVSTIQNFDEELFDKPINIIFQSKCSSNETKQTLAISKESPKVAHESCKSVRLKNDIWKSIKNWECRKETLFHSGSFKLPLLSEAEEKINSKKLN